MAIFDVLKGAKAKEAPSSPEEGAAAPDAPKTGYRTLIKESAEAGDWDAFADAVAEFCKQSK